jgi:hypothetical protein
VLTIETRRLIKIFKSKLITCTILEILYRGIEDSLKEVLITKEAMANFSSSTAAHVRLSRGDTWLNEIQFDQGEDLGTPYIRHNPRLLENHQPLVNQW